MVRVWLSVKSMPLVKRAGLILQEVIKINLFKVVEKSSSGVQCFLGNHVTGRLYLLKKTGMHSKRCYQHWKNLHCEKKNNYVLSYNLWCYTRTFCTEKSRNNISINQYRFFSRVFDIANQLLTRHSPFASLGKVDEWTAKPSTFSIQGRLSESFWIKAAKTLSVSLKESDIQTFPEGEEDQNTERKTESYIFIGYGDLNCFNAFFILSLSAIAQYDFIRELSIPLFSFINMVDFSCL